MGLGLLTGAHSTGKSNPPLSVDRIELDSDLGKRFFDFSPLASTGSSLWDCTVEGFSAAGVVTRHLKEFTFIRSLVSPGAACRIVVPRSNRSSLSLTSSSEPDSGLLLPVPVPLLGGSWLAVFIPDGLPSVIPLVRLPLSCGPGSLSCQA